MPLTDLKLVNYRSYQESEFDLSPEITVITGPNGSGKTNLVEAIYVLSMTKSWRGQAQELIKTGSDWFRLEGLYENKNYTVKFKEDKKLTINGKQIKPQRFLGSIPVVLFEPGDLSIVIGSPSERRRFLDSSLSAIDHQYISALIKYRRILMQRNKTLRIKPLPREQIFAWDLLLVREATTIVSYRKRFIDFLSNKLKETYQSIAGSKDNVSVEYKGLDNDNYSDKLLQKLEDNLERDVILGSTSSGPHRDDLRFYYQGHPFTTKGSRGESRSLALAIKSLQKQYVEVQTGKKPILLLDDVFSELDESRQRNILKHCDQVQTIITTTHIPKTLSKPYVIKLP